MAKKVYVGVDGKARRVKKIYVGVGASVSLPSGYTQVEYIQSSSTQYINTGFKPNNASRIVLDIDVTATSGQAALFGTRNGGGSSGFCVFTYDNNAGYQVDYGSSQAVGVGGNSSGRHILDLHQHVFYVDANPVNIATTQSFSCSYNAYLFSISSGGNVMTSYSCSAKLYACQIYDNGTKIRDFVPCKNPSGTVGLYDTVNGKFYANDGSGTFTAGASLTSSGIARKVKKGYIGVGGVARQFYSSMPELVYQGTINAGTTAINAASTTVGDYAIIGGGSDGGQTMKTSVLAYNSSLTKSNPTALSAARQSIGATTVGNYALFGGGHTSSGNYTYSSAVDAYNTSLTRSTPTALSQARTCSATTVGNYALFGGGSYRSNDTKAYSAVVDAYNASLTRSTPTALSVGRDSVRATTVGNYALFGGGNNDSYLSTVDAYNASLTRSTPTALSQARRGTGATTVGNYALFAGGYSFSSGVGTTEHNTVDAYSASLVRSTPTTLSVARDNLPAATLGNYALFGPAYYGKTTVDAYDINLTRSTPNALSGNRSGCVIATVGNYALFYGGYVVTIDLYQEIE